MTEQANRSGFQVVDSQSMPDGLQLTYGESPVTFNVRVGGHKVSIFKDSGRLDVQLSGFRPETVKTRTGREFHVLHTKRVRDLMDLGKHLPRIIQNLQAARDNWTATQQAAS
ncbi:MAG: hypothetical protein K9N51_11570 [Candidatus Pacebacteria bacterium]|nr:hypothetical protein [Candidatus Paceibacterota bacterium]